MPLSFPPPTGSALTVGWPFVAAAGLPAGWTRWKADPQPEKAAPQLPPKTRRRKTKWHWAGVPAPHGLTQIAINLYRLFT
jgi:hypothetical protein